VRAEEELLNRIAAIQAAAEILDDNHELSYGDRHAFLTVIQSEAARLHALVQRMTSSFPDCLRLGSATSV
jgi:nitrogen-specific signal transduction histidine kinase